MYIDLLKKAYNYSFIKKSLNIDLLKKLKVYSHTVYTGLTIPVVYCNGSDIQRHKNIPTMRLLVVGAFVPAANDRLDSSFSGRGSSTRESRSQWADSAEHLSATAVASSTIDG